MTPWSKLFVSIVVQAMPFLVLGVVLAADRVGQRAGVLADIEGLIQ